MPRATTSKEDAANTRLEPVNRTEGQGTKLAPRPTTYKVRPVNTFSPF